MRPLSLSDPALLAPHLASAVEDSEVTSWVARAVANGGGVSTATRTAVNTFMAAIKAAGIRSKIYRLNLFCGNDFVHDSTSVMGAVGVPLIIDKGSATDTNSANNAAWSYNETGSSGGLQTPQTPGNAWLDTGLVPSTDFSNNTSAHCAVYVRTSLNESSFGLGTQYNGSPFSSFALTAGPYGNALTQGYCNEVSGNPSVSDSLGTGFYLISRTASNAEALYKNSSSIASVTTAPSSLPNLSILVYAFHAQSPTASQFCSKRLGGYSIGLGLTSSEASAFYTAMQAFQTALTRNV